MINYVSDWFVLPDAHIVFKVSQKMQAFGQYWSIINIVVTVGQSLGPYFMFQGLLCNLSSVHMVPYDIIILYKYTKNDFCALFITCRV